MTLQEIRNISIGIERPFHEVYDFLAEPGNFRGWASGLGDSFAHVEGMDWSVETPMGRMIVRFTERNPYGIIDHALIPENGAPMHNPVRVVPNGDGSEVIFTLFRRPGMSDDEMERDAEWVARDFKALKALLEERG